MDLIEGAPWFRVRSVVLDVQDSLKIQERLARGKYAVPVIVMTSDNEREVREKALAAGAEIRAFPNYKRSVVSQR